MINLYVLHKNPKKLDFYKRYETPIEQICDEILIRKDNNYQPILHIIKKDPKYAYMYVRDVLESRFIDAEPHIMKNPFYAYAYALHILNGRWHEAEKYIMDKPEAAFYYARDIIKGRWPEAEPTIMVNPWHAYCYAMYVIKDRWLEAEPIIMKEQNWWSEYTKVFEI
jgi:hypothetical protein